VKRDKQSQVRATDVWREAVLSVSLALLVLVLGVTVGKLGVLEALVSAIVVGSAVTVGAILVELLRGNVSSGYATSLDAITSELKAIKSELARLNTTLPTRLLTDEQYSRFEATATERIIICKHEMGAEFDPDPSQRDSAIAYDKIVRDNVTRGVSYCWLAPITKRNQTRMDFLYDAIRDANLDVSGVRVHLLDPSEWERLPFSLETVFIQTKENGRRHIEAFLQIPLSDDLSQRFWTRMAADRRDEWFGTVRQHIGGVEALAQPTAP
jgi:hypothetical protein